MITLSRSDMVDEIFDDYDLRLNLLKELRTKEELKGSDDSVAV